MAYVVSDERINQQNYPVEQNKLTGLTDLPNFLQFVLKYSGARHKKTAFVLSLLGQLACVPVWTQMTGSLLTGIMLCLFFTAGNTLTTTLVPDMSKGVLLNIFLEDEKKTKEMSEAARFMFQQNFCFLLAIIPCFIVFFQLPFLLQEFLGHSWGACSTASFKKAQINRQTMSFLGMYDML